MKIVMFYHSVVSDWNHGNAHFLRGIATEFIKRGHAVEIYEPRSSWSVSNLIAMQGSEPLREFRARFPLLKSQSYKLDQLDLDRALEGADLVLVHEWNEPALVRRIGQHRFITGGKYNLFFHDTHHRAVTAPEQMRHYDLTHYDGVLAYGDLLREVYRRQGWAWRAWTWHEAADTNVFRMSRNGHFEGDVVWIGNWGDDERTEELEEFLIEPVKTLRLRAKVFSSLLRPMTGCCSSIPMSHPNREMRSLTISMSCPNRRRSHETERRMRGGGSQSPMAVRCSTRSGQPCRTSGHSGRRAGR